MRAAVLLVATLGVGLGLRNARAEVSIVGDWYEDITVRGERVISIAHFRNDGTARVEFRHCRGPAYFDVVQTGRWAYRANILHLVTETANGLPDHDEADYTTDKIDARMWDYHLSGGLAFLELGPIAYHDLKVTPDSKLPGCDLVS